MRSAALLSSAWEHWTTPESFLARVRRLGRIGLDPCANEASTVGASCQAFGLKKAARMWGSETAPEDGLTLDWRACLLGASLVFVNPPYGRAIPPWAAKMAMEGRRGAEIVALLPARTDAGWFQRHILDEATALLFWGPGRISFDNPPVGVRGAGSTVSNAVAYWGPRPRQFGEAFEGCGTLITFTQRLQLFSPTGIGKFCNVTS